MSTVIKKSESYSTTVSCGTWTYYNGSWLSESIKPMGKLTSPEPKIVTTYTKEERKEYMVQIKAVVALLRSYKWKEIIFRTYKIQKKYNHPDEFLLLANKKDYYFKLKLGDNREITILIEDKYGETFHQFSLNYNTGLDRTTKATGILLEYLSKTLTLKKELKTVNVNSRSFLIDNFIES